MEWLQGTRGIPKEVLERNGVSNRELMGKDTLVFPYTVDGKVVNEKYRQSGKRFTSLKGGQVCLYGLDGLKGQDAIILVEGEIDKLSVEAAGLEGAASVPTGAAANPESILGFGGREALEAARTVVLATDADDAGRRCAWKLAETVGWDKCTVVTWRDGCKDANEVLVKHGLAAVREDIEGAIPARWARDVVSPSARHGEDSREESKMFENQQLAAENIRSQLLEITPQPLQMLVGQNFSGQQVQCPQCGGGERKENSFSVRVEDGCFLYKCFRANKCGCQGKLYWPKEMTRELSSA